jgi:hypothetical protein
VRHGERLRIAKAAIGLSPVIGLSETQVRDQVRGHMRAPRFVSPPEISDRYFSPSPCSARPFRAWHWRVRQAALRTAGGLPQRILCILGQENTKGIRVSSLRQRIACAKPTTGAIAIVGDGTIPVLGRLRSSRCRLPTTSREKPPAITTSSLSEACRRATSGFSMNLPKEPGRYSRRPSRSRSGRRRH